MREPATNSDQNKEVGNQKVDEPNCRGKKEMKYNSSQVGTKKGKSGLELAPPFHNSQIFNAPNRTLTKEEKKTMNASPIQPGAVRERGINWNPMENNDDEETKYEGASNDVTDKETDAEKGETAIIATLVPDDPTVYEAVVATSESWLKRKKWKVVVGLGFFLLTFIVVVVTLITTLNAKEVLIITYSPSKVPSEIPSIVPTGTLPTENPSPLPTGPPAPVPTPVPSSKPTISPPFYSKSDIVPPISTGGSSFDHFTSFGYGEDNDSNIISSNVNKISQIQVFVIPFGTGIAISLATTYILEDGSKSTKRNGAYTEERNPTATLDFENDEYISRIEVLSESDVSHIKICTTNSQCFGPYGRSLEVPANASFQSPGSVIIALHGRSGSWVDAIGVYYKQD